MSLFFEAAAKWGLGIVLAIILVFMFKRFLNRAFDSFTEERKNYMELLNKQCTVMENHMSHLTESNNNLIVKIETQKECMEHGFNRVVDAVEAQTKIL